MSIRHRHTETYMETHKYIHRHIDRYTHRHIDIYTDTQQDRPIERQTHIPHLHIGQF